MKFKKVIIGLILVGLINSIVGLNVFSTDTNVKPVDIVKPASPIRLDGKVAVFGINKPYINEANRTMVPMSYIIKEFALIKTVVGKDITLQNGKDSIKYTTNKAVAYKNNKLIILDAQVIVKGAETYIPVSSLITLFGCKVIWDKNTNNIDIYKPFDYGIFSINDITDPNDVNVFTSYSYYSLDNGDLRFKLHDDTGKIVNAKYFPANIVNKNLKTNAVDIIKDLLGKTSYTFVGYSRLEDYPEFIKISYSRSRGYFQNDSKLFSFSLYSDKYLDASKEYSKSPKFSNRVFLRLDIDRMWWETDDNSNDYSPVKQGWSMPLYESKLKNCIYSVFGSTYSADIYYYILTTYKKYTRTDSDEWKNINITKIIGNIQIDYGRENGQSFYFSYIK
jgi:hypothetical protein